MSESFVKFKRQFLAVSIIKASACGIGAGSAICGIFTLLTRLEVTDVKPWLVILISVLSAAAVGTGVFLLLGRTDRQLARRLDRDFSLKEKMQTMLQYKDEEGAIYELQRKDATASLDSVSSQRIGLRYIWIYILGLVLGLTLLTVGLLIPAKEQGGGGDTRRFKLTDIQRAAIVQLIEHVEESDMDSPYRENVAGHLTVMLEELTEADYMTERDASVAKATEAIIKEADSSSPALEIINALGSSDSKVARLMARAINYYDWSLGTEWDDFEAKMLEAQLRITAEAESSDEATATANLKNVLSHSGTSIINALVASGASETDELYGALLAYSITESGETDSFFKISDSLPGIGRTEAQSRISAMFTAYNTALFLISEGESINTGTCEYAVIRVCELFGLTRPIFERPALPKEDEESGSHEDEGGGGGGIGIGTLYPSNDPVLDPNTDKFVSYGELFLDYYRIMTGKIESDKYTEEEKAAIKKYFEILRGNESDNEN